MFIKLIEQFTDDEKAYINHQLQYRILEQVKKQDLIENLEYQVFVADKEDDELIEFYTDLINKLKMMSDDDWNELKSFTPLETIHTPLVYSVITGEFVEQN